MHQPHRTAAVAVRQLPRQPEHVGEHRRIARRGGRFLAARDRADVAGERQATRLTTTAAAYDGGVLSLADRVTQHFSEHLHGGGRAVVELVLTDLHQRRQVECLDVTDDRRPRGDPRVVEAEHRYLTHDQVRQLADLCGRYRLVVLFLAYTGARFGEMAALQVGRLDFLHRRAVIAESVTEVSGVQVWGTPKGHARREVPVPRFLLDELAVHVAGKDRAAFVFAAAKGGALRVRAFRRAAFDAAALAAGIEGLHPHELRHTAASLAIASDANIKVVQRMVGHKSATMTLDLYRHLFPDQLDEVADTLDPAARAAVAHP
jgi:integrase